MRYVIWLLILIAIPSITTAETISKYDGGSTGFLGVYGYGQSVLTPSGGPWTNITFGFLSWGSGYAGYDHPNPAAPGQLFVLTQEYTGLFPDLDQGAPGFLATGNTPSTAYQQVGNQRFYYAYWEFNNSLVLSPNTRYYFYASQPLLGVGQSVGPFDEQGTNQGYTTANPTAEPRSTCHNSYSVPYNCPFVPLFIPLGVSTTSFNYVLGGVIPEPETYAMLLAGLGLFGFMVRRRKQKAA